MGIASLVLGIIALVVYLFSFGSLSWLAAVLGLVGIILGTVAKKNEEKKGMATAGLVLSIIALVLGLLTYIACIACVGCVGCVGSAL